MKFEVYLNCCLARGYWYMVVGFQLKDLVTFTTNEKYDVIMLTELCEYAEYDYKAGSEAF